MNKLSNRKNLRLTLIYIYVYVMLMNRIKIIKFSKILFSRKVYSYCIKKS